MLDLESEAMRGPGSIPTGGNILSLDFFHVVKPLMPILALLPPTNVVCEGYVFTGVCLSMGGMHSREACVAGGAGVAGGVCGKGVCMVGVCMAGVCMAGGMHGRGHVWGACVAGGMHGRGHACHTVLLPIPSSL